MTTTYQTKKKPLTVIRNNVRVDSDAIRECIYEGKVFVTKTDATKMSIGQVKRHLRSRGYSIGAKRICHPRYDKARYERNTPKRLLNKAKREAAVLSGERQ